MLWSQIISLVSTAKVHHLVFIYHVPINISMYLYIKTSLHQDLYQSISSVFSELLTFSPIEEPVSEPTPASPVSRPTPASPTSQPTPASPASQPTPASPASQPTPVSPTSRPTPASPIRQPTPASPTSRPTPASPTSRPTPASLIRQPTPASPTSRPTPASPTSRPTPASPTSRPTPASPIRQPTPASPIRQPTPASPIRQPTPASPTSQPTPASPTSRPTPASPIRQPTPASPTSRPTPASPTSRSTPASPTSRPTPASPIRQPTPASPTSRPTPASPTCRPTPASPTSRPTPASPTSQLTPASPTPASPTSRPTPASPTSRPTPAESQPASQPTVELTSNTMPEPAKNMTADIPPFSPTHPVGTTVDTSYSSDECISLFDVQNTLRKQSKKAARSNVSNSEMFNLTKSRKRSKHDYDIKSEGYKPKKYRRVRLPSISDEELPPAKNPSDHEISSHSNSHVDHVTPADDITIPSLAHPVDIQPDQNDTNTNHHEHGMKRGRKRTRDETTWKRNILKRAKTEGKEYCNAKGRRIPAKSIGPGCDEKCRQKCHNNISETQRLQIFREYYGLGNRDQQGEFILKTLQKVPKKQCLNTDGSKRNCSIIWSLIVDVHVHVKVCKKFYLHTLAINEGVAHHVLSNVSGEGILKRDSRGKHNKNNRLPDSARQGVKEHINSFNRVESHYCRKDSVREYLGEDLSLAAMYRLYLKWCTEKKISVPAMKWCYYHIFNHEFNLGFHRPKKDQCDLCEKYRNCSSHQKEELQTEYDIHQRNKILSRAEKEVDKQKALTDATLITSAFDLQKVLPLPTGDASQFYYKRKLSMYNFTIYDMGNHAGYCYMWYEIIGGRGSNEVSTCVYQYIKKCAAELDAKNFIFYSDNCGGQNRNHYIAGMYLKALADNPTVESITHKYLEVGHTQNEADSMHACIERAIGRTPVYSPHQYYFVARTAKKTGAPYNVTEMAEFSDFKYLVDTNTKNWMYDTNGEKVRWNQMRVISVNRSEPSVVAFKNSYKDVNFRKLNINARLRGTRVNSSHPEMKSLILRKQFGPKAISKKKYDDILHLCNSGIVPNEYRTFFEQLPHELQSSDTKDIE